MGHRNIVKGAVACVAFAWAASAAAAGAPAWRVCRAESPKLDGVIYMLQSAPIDTQSYPDFLGLLAAQRPFEAPLKAMGATRLREAHVACTAAMPTAEEARKEADPTYQKELLGTVGVRVIEKPWVVSVSRDPQPAALLVGLGELASRATLASGPEKWGLTRADYSRMHNTALVKKADVAGRRPALEKAAAAGDAYAQHLLAIRPDGQEDDLVMMKKAADQGLLRAMVDYLGQTPWPNAPAAAKERVAELKRLLVLGSPHAAFSAGLSLMQSEDKADQQAGMRAVFSAVKAGYAPAQLVVAESAIKSEKEEDRRQAITLAKEAAAQGLPGAQAFLKAHPAP